MDIQIDIIALRWFVPSGATICPTDKLKQDKLRESHRLILQCKLSNVYCQQCALSSWNTLGNQKLMHIGFGPWNITWEVKYDLRICQSFIKKLMKNGRRDGKHHILELTKLGDNTENSMLYYIRSMAGLQACHQAQLLYIVLIY